MTLVDFGHLSSRILHTAVSQVNPKVDKATGKFNTDDWASMYVHLLLKNLSYLKMNFEHEFGELVICVDNRGNWRKEKYPDYKGNRKKDRDDSKIDYETFYVVQDEIIEQLDLHFPFRVLRVDRCEADDIVGVLAKEYAKVEKTIVISSDKDFKQVLSYGAQLFDPIAKVYVKMTPEELKQWEIEHILGGDAGDNVPNIKAGTEFTPEFRLHLAENGVYKDIPVNEFLDMAISKDLFDKFQIYEVITAGKLKGQLRDTKKIFKKIPFGEKGIHKFAEDLKENLQSNILYAKHYKRNRELVLFDYIPEDVRTSILEAYKVAEIHYDTAGIMGVMTKYNLMELMRSVSDFFQSPKQAQAVAAVDEWS